MLEVFRRKCVSTPAVLLAAFLFLASAAWARVPEPYQIEPVQLDPAAKLPKTLTDGLDPQGLRLFTFENGVRMNVCDIFWAKSVSEQEASPTAGKSPSPKLVYGNLRPGAFVGVIHFLPEADQEYRKDFRNQKLKPGYYTLRYGVMEAGIGEHGPVPGDFAVLAPVALDTNYARAVSKTELLRLSRAASHTKDPAVMSLIEVTVARKDFPDVSTDYAGTCVLQVKLHMKAKKGETAGQEMAMAIVVETPLEEGEGS